MLEPTDKVAISLTITEWNQILAVLSDQPFKTVAGLIGQITQQAQAAVAQSDKVPSPASYLNSLNGELPATAAATSTAPGPETMP